MEQPRENPEYLGEGTRVNPFKPLLRGITPSFIEDVWTTWKNKRDALSDSSIYVEFGDLLYSVEYKPEMARLTEMIGVNIAKPPQELDYQVDIAVLNAIRLYSGFIHQLLKDLV